jgi:hypothetical protein
MYLANPGDPLLLPAMGVQGVVLGSAPGANGEELGTVVTPENVALFVRQAQHARDQGLLCRWIYPDWRLVEKVVDDDGYLDRITAVLEALAEHGLTDLFVSCGLRPVERLSPKERECYQDRFRTQLGRLYRRADDLGLYVCLHSSLMPWIFLCDPDAWDRWLADLPSPANSILLCLGCVGSAGLDAADLIGRWKQRVRAVHIRNVVGSFHDRSHRDVRVDCGTLDLPRIFSELSAAGFEGPLIPEHFPDLPGDGGHRISQAFALGYCRGLIQACSNPAGQS